MSKKHARSLAVELDPFISPFRVDGSEKFRLKAHKTNARGGLDKEQGEEILAANRKWLAHFQEKLYAQDRWSLLLIFQGMDASGKDSAIKSGFDGVNPQGCEVTAFKQPSSKELDHDFMWRSAIALPERGRQSHEPSFATREATNVEMKKRIGAAAAALIQNGQSVVLDASTTALQIARVLDTQRSLHDVTVITNGVHTALELLDAPGLSTILTGGQMRATAVSARAFGAANSPIAKARPSAAIAERVPVRVCS